jgi:hypothetical protein
VILAFATFFIAFIICCLSESLFVVIAYADKVKSKGARSIKKGEHKKTDWISPTIAGSNDSSV